MKRKGERDRLMVLLQNEPETRRTPETTTRYARPVWPDAVALREVLQNPAAMLTPELDLCSSVVALDRGGFPLAFTGRFAVVFRLVLPGDIPAALRLFTSRDGSFGADREARCERSAQSLTRLQAQIGDLLPPFVYLPRAVRVGEVWYPAQVMPWADGQPLLSFVAQNRDNPAALRTLAGTLTAAVERLEAAGVVHGDLQHDNIVVSEQGDRVTLVDYDALYTPDLSDFAPPAERGHPNYQHPLRRAADYGAGTDRFPLAVIRTGLLLLSNAPHFWEQTGGEASEGILFTAADFAAPQVSPLFIASRQYAAHDAELAESLALLHDLCLEASPAAARTIPSMPAPVLRAGASPVPPRYPSRVTPTCEEEKAGPLSYVAPLHTAAFRQEEETHFHIARAYLHVVPPAVAIAWLMAWEAGGTKWPFLAYLLVLLAGLQLAFLYLTWGVKRQRDALDLEYAKLMEAERLGAESATRLQARLARWKAKGIPEPDARQEREHLRTALSHVPLSRAIADSSVSAAVVRELRNRGIQNAAHLWQRHGFLPTGIDAGQAALLRAWLGALEARERERFAREANPVLAIGDQLSRIASASEKRRKRLAELRAWRDSFPVASFSRFLRHMLPWNAPGLEVNARA